jgi:hypothetical protein
VALFGKFPSPFDEHAHFSYAWHILQTGEVLPSLDELRLIEPGRSPAGAMTRIT